jgi:nucleotide-binding universal stress UspA family protein
VEDPIVEVHKILVPVDFSEHSQRALDEAVGLAKHFGAQLMVFHCYPIPIPSVASVPYDTVPPESYLNAVRTAALQGVTEWRNKARAQGVRAEGQIGTGSPSSEIAALAEKIGADLIVIGTRGVSGLKHVLLGSVAERTIRTAPCPVLTVKGVAAARPSA